MAQGRNGRSGAAGVARTRRRAQTWLFALAFLSLLAGTAAGVVLARDDAEEAVVERARRAADRAAAAVESTTRAALAGVAGAGAVVGADGELDRDVFAAFGRDLLDTGDVQGVGLIAVVDAADRDEVEAVLGAPFVVLEGDELVPAPVAPTYHPIVAFVSSTEGASPIGLDFSGDPVRGAAIAAAADTGRATVSGVLRSTASGVPAIAIVKPLLDGQGEVVGFVSTGLRLEPLEQAVTAAVGGGAEVALVDGADVVFGPTFDERDPTEGATAEVAGRRWRVVARAVEEPDLRLSWIILGAGVLAGVVLTWLLVVTERHQRRLARANAMLAFGSQRGRAVQDLAGRLARALSGDEVAAALLEQLPAAVGAESAAIATASGAGQLQLIGAGRRGVEDRTTIVPEPGTKVAETLASGEPAWLPSPLAWRDEEATSLLAGEGWALALLPIASDDVEGVLAVSYPSVHTFEEDEKALLATVGVLAARALSRARRYDTEHGAAVAFQRAALPSGVPDVPGLTIAARYRPGTQWATVGGDWYDVLVADERRVVLVVGDVVGHGMAAAASMGRLRTAFQTIATVEADPGRIVETISAQVPSIPDAFCTTAVCMVIDLEDRTLTWCRAGHPPPLLVDASGGHLLDEEGLPPLGVLPEATGPVHRRTLHGGESLVLYTDGVVERRGESLDQGFQRLAFVTGELVDLEPEELIDALLEAVVPADQQADDVVVLVVRLDPRPPDGTAGVGAPAVVVGDAR